MKQKRKSPTTLAGDTGNKYSNKYTKRNRIKVWKQVTKWSNPDEVLTMEGGLR